MFVVINVVTDIIGFFITCVELILIFVLTYLKNYYVYLNASAVIYAWYQEHISYATQQHANKLAIFSYISTHDTFYKSFKVQWESHR